MFRWNLMLRTLFGLRYDQAKARPAKKTVKLILEGLEDRTMPSASLPNLPAFEAVASPPPVPSVATLASPAPVPSAAAFTSYAFATLDHWFQFMATAEQEFLGDLTLVTQEFAQLESSVRQQVGRFLGNNSNAANPALNTTVTQPSNDMGVGRGNSSGSGSGSSASTTHGPSNQALNNSTQQSGSGSGSGSSSTVNHPIAPAHGGIVHPMTSGTGSGTGIGSGASGSGTGSAGGGGTGSGYGYVSGKLWLDDDGDGSWDNGELGYQGATVELMSASMKPYSVAAVATTDSDGKYAFPPLLLGPQPQPFFVHVVMPGDFTDTLPGSSEINNADNSSIFQLAAGGWRKILAGLLAMNVNTTADHPPGQPIQDKVTLRDAIETGNDGGGPFALNKVTFYDYQNQKELSGTITLQSALDPIKRSYDIYYEPGAPGLAVNGNKNAGTIFTVNAGVASTISNLTITGGLAQQNGGGILNNGELTLSGDVISNNGATGAGGGVFNAAGAQLQLQTVTISGNGAKNGGGLGNSGSVTICCNSVINNNDASTGGGGIWNHGGTIEAFDSTQIKLNLDNLNGGGVENEFYGKFQMYGGAISDNEDNQVAGGVALLSGTITLTDVAVQGNYAAVRGGGIYVGGGTLTLTNDVTIVPDANGKKNQAGIGGGMFVNAGTVKMSGGAIDSNSAMTTGPGGALGAGGGGLYVNLGGIVILTAVGINLNASRFNGAGVYVNGGSLELNKDFIGNNYTQTILGGKGGGMFMNGGFVTVSGGTIENNSAPFGAGNGGGIFNNAGALTLKNDVKIFMNSAKNDGGGMYLANASTTTINGVEVTSNKATTGPGVFEERNANVTIARGGLTDNDDPGGVPFRSGVA